MLKKSYYFTCNFCGKEYPIPFKERIQSVAIARTYLLTKSWKYKGQNVDICPDCMKIEYRNKPSSLKRERNLAITILFIRGTSMHKIAKQYNTSAQRIHQIIHREINKKKSELSSIKGFTDSQETSFLKRCLQYREKTISILRQGQSQK